LPPEKGLTEVTAGLSTLPGCPRLWPCVIPSASQTLPQPSHMSSYILCGGQNLPHHSSSCLVISCVSVKPFPFSPFLFLVILTQHTMTHNTDLFYLSLIILNVCAHPKSVYLSVFQYFSHTVQPDGLVSSLSKQQLQQP